MPGVTIVGLVALARALGAFEVAEWKALDIFLRGRPPEPQDSRILIVGINEVDIQQVGTYPIPDADLAGLLQTLAQYEPRVIGVDLYRGLPIEPGNLRLIETLQAQPNIIGIERVTGVTSDISAAPPALPIERVGIVDFPLDGDGFVRRAYLGTLPSETAADPDRFRFSLALKLAEQYLAEENLALENGLRNPQNMRFGRVELPRFTPNIGSYINADAVGVQILINPRSHEVPFEMVSMTDVLAGRVDASLIRDRAVLVGVTAQSAKDLINSAAIKSDNPGLVYGVEMHAHVTSQILSSVLSDRPMIIAWNNFWEFAWLVLWGGFGAWLLYFKLPTLRHAIATLAGGCLLVATCFGWLWLAGLWLPVIPPLTAFLLLSFPGFLLYEATLRERIEERQQIIEQTYDAIHNGPLQSLAILLKEKAELSASVSGKLENLNQEIRTIYIRLLQESLPIEDQLPLGSQRVIDLRNPLSEVLYEVYAETLSRNLPGFDSLKFQVVKFEPLQADGLSSSDRRSLCRFLEEALCNVGKHATDPKRLTVVCMATARENLIQVADNGKNTGPFDRGQEGRGTQQAHALARRLKGQFHRSISETGSFCELRWPGKSARRLWNHFPLPKPANK